MGKDKGIIPKGATNLMKPLDNDDMFPKVKTRGRYRSLVERLKYSMDQKIHSKVGFKILFYQISYHYLRILLALQIYNPMIDKLQQNSPDGVDYNKKFHDEWVAMNQAADKQVEEMLDIVKTTMPGLFSFLMEDE